MRFRVLLIVPLAVIAAACGSSNSSSNTSSSPAATSTSSANANLPTGISTRKFPVLGTILVNQSGRTLYVFTPEKGGKLVCTGSCAALWPPLKNSGQTPPLASLVHPNLVGSVTDPSGGKIITYSGYPLHTYAPDTLAGDIKGQGIDGKWYVISPFGTVITKKPASSSSSSSSGYGSGGY